MRSRYVVVGSDTLDGAQCARAEAGAGAIGDPQIHGDADDRHLDIAEIGIGGVDRSVGCAKKGRDTLASKHPRGGPPSAYSR